MTRRTEKHVRRVFVATHITTRLPSKHGNPTFGTNIPSATPNAKVGRSLCSSYIGENFTVIVKECMRFTLLITDTNRHGIVCSNFRPLKAFGRMRLTAGAEKMGLVPNAGGSSVISEVLSCEMLMRAFGAKLMKTEMEVMYFPHGGSITDYTCRVYNLTIGVSVTRAMKYRGDLTVEDATRLLNKKLAGVVQATRNCLDVLDRQILHVWTMNKNSANVVVQAYSRIADDIKANTLVLVTVAENNAEIFWNR